MTLATESYLAQDARYADEWLVEVEDISAFVAEQRATIDARGYAHLLTPREAIYPVGDAAVARRLDLAERPTGI